VTNTVTTTTGPPQQIQQQQLEEGQEIDDGPRIPLSIQANYYAPLRREPTHGLPVCNLQLRSFSVPNLELMCDFALRAAYYAHLPASGPIPLPKRIERWTVPRSNFVNKKSQENFERITYKRLIQIKDGNIETVEMWLAFLKMHQYHGVGLKANIWTWDEVGMFNFFLLFLFFSGGYLLIKNLKVSVKT
jgi:small subunit ribosomal protein S10